MTDKLDEKLEEVLPIEGELKDYGFRFTVITPDQYQSLGAVTSLPKVILSSERDWTPYYPTYEPQFGPDWDSYGCTIWGTQNAVETMLKFIEGIEYNFSERYNYNIVGINPPGTDPQLSCESIRNYGLIDQKILPFTKSYQEFCTPRPMKEVYLKEGARFKYTIKHEWVWANSISKDERIKRIREYLQYSPLCISVTAWFKQGDVYVDNGMKNTHWCMLGREVVGKGWEIFDSYDQTIKIISYDHNIQCAKRFHIVAKELTPTFFQYLWKLVSELLTGAKELKAKSENMLPIMPPSLPPEPPPIIETKPDLSLQGIKNTIVSVCAKEGVESQLALAVASVESDFIPTAKQRNKDKYQSLDRGLYQLNSYWYSHIPDDVAYDPEGATKVFCRAIKSGRLVDWKHSMRGSVSRPGWGKKVDKEIVLKYMSEADYNKYA